MANTCIADQKSHHHYHCAEYLSVVALGMLTGEIHTENREVIVVLSIVLNCLLSAPVTSSKTEHGAVMRACDPQLSHPVFTPAGDMSLMPLTFCHL